MSVVYRLQGLDGEVCLGVGVSVSKLAVDFPIYICTVHCMAFASAARSARAHAEGLGYGHIPVVQ